MEQVRELISLMEKHDLSAVDLQSGEQRWRLRRGPQSFSVVPAAPMYSAPIAAPPPAPTAAAAPAPAAAAPAAAPAPVNDGSILITSESVGTFYAAPSEDSPPYVSVGSNVKAGDVVCQIEAMKVFTQITADVAGTILEVLVKNEDYVDFGKPLFRIKPA